MAIITITRAAKCKDCKYCSSYLKGKAKRHRCTNKQFTQDNDIRLNDSVCMSWQIN